MFRRQFKFVFQLFVLCWPLSVAAQSLPEEVSELQDFEQISPLDVLELPAEGSDASRRRLAFQALGKSFDLEVEPAGLYSAGAAIHWVGKNETTLQAPSEAVYYKGRLHGQPDSWVRLAVRDGVLDGIIRTAEQVYFISPSSRFDARSKPGAMLVYRLSDTAPLWNRYSCGIEHAVDEADMRPVGTGDAPLADYRKFLGLTKQIATLTLREAEIALVADGAYFSLHGSASAQQMADVINAVAGIYENEFGITFRIVSSTVYTTGTDPFTSSTAPSTLLFNFTQDVPHLAGADIAHLFTGRDLDGSTVGIAFLEAVCDGTYATGLSQNLSSTGLRTLLTAHEIGHNFSAIHDGGGDCSAAPPGHIMSSFLDPSATSFSSCSKSFIDLFSATLTCLSPVTVTDPLQADLAMAAGLSASSVTVGQEVTISATVTNQGPAASTGAVISYELPSSLSFISSNGAGCSLSGSTVSCTLQALAAGSQATVSLQLRADSADSINNTISVSGVESDPDASNNAAAVNLSIVTPGGGSPSVDAGSVQASSFVFSPNGDALNDTVLINFSLSKPDLVTIEILDRNGQLVATPLSGVAFAQGQQTASWDGRTSTGSTVIDGLYTLRLRDSGGASIERTLGVNNSIPEAKNSWFLAEGSTVGFSAFVLIQNPNGVAVDTVVTFFKQDGDTVVYSERVAARSRTTVPIHAHVPDTFSVSTRVEADLPILVERAMYFGANGQGGHDSTGSTSTSQTWYFPTNRAFPGDEDFILIVNPSTGTASVTATFLREGSEPLVENYSVSGTSRFTIAVHGVVPGERSSVILQSSLPVVAERAFYINGRTGGAAGIGAVSPSLSWYFAQGDTSSFRTTSLEIMNPGNTAAAVTVTYSDENGQGNTAGFNVGARRRLSVDTLGQAGADRRFWMEVTSSQPVVAERLMFSGTDVGDTIGTPTPAYSWSLAEGFTAFGYQTFVEIANTSASAAQVTILYQLQDGSNVQRQLTIAPRGKVTANVNLDIAPQASSVSTTVTSDQPIVVERTMTFGNGLGTHQAMGIR